MKSRNTNGTLRSRVAIAAVTAGLVASLGPLMMPQSPPQEDANPTPVANPVARFNGQDYDSFDAALAAASSTDGATIELLADAQTKGLNLSRDLTIDGAGHSLTFTDKGVALWGHALVLKNVNASMSGVGSTPYTAEWNWMSVCASKDASLTLDAASTCATAPISRLRTMGRMRSSGMVATAATMSTSRVAPPTPPTTTALVLRVRSLPRSMPPRST